MAILYPLFVIFISIGIFVLLWFAIVRPIARKIGYMDSGQSIDVLERKIVALKQIKDKLVEVNKEVNVTIEITQYQKHIEKAEGNLAKAEAKMKQKEAE